MRKSILIILSLLVVLVMPAYAQDAAPEVQGPGVGTYITENFVRLGEALQAAGLVDTLNGGTFTVFVPNDGSFGTLLTDLDLSLNDLVSNQALLTGVLTYHVVPGRYTGAEVLAAGALETVQGASLSFGSNAADAVIINGGAASVEIANVSIGSSIVHVIDNVLLPPNAGALLIGAAAEPVEEVEVEAAPGKNLVQIAQDTVVVLTEAVVAADLVDVLSGGEFTVFIPKDGAFATLLAAQELSIAELLADQSGLTSILTYHVVPGIITAEDLVSGRVTSAETVNGASLSFSFDPTISRVLINGGQATVEQANLFASNGVAHIIDNVLLP